MYYFYASRSDFSYHDFYRFIVKRWVRLSPAFYAVALIYLLVSRFIYHHEVDFTLSMIRSIFYMDYFLANYQVASHFWTLTVEWQFYFIIPLILIYQHVIGFKKSFASIFGLVIGAAVISVLILKNSSDYFAGTFLFRGIEFGFGILAARLFLLNNNYFKRRGLWFVMFIIIIYTGRILVSKSVLNLSLNYYNLFKLAGFTSMGAGFAGVLYLSISSTGKLSAFLGSKMCRNMGRISYSFYLLHALVYPVIVGLVIAYLPFLKGIAAPITTTVISAVILYPISLLSFRFLEQPFLAIGNLTTK